MQRAEGKNTIIEISSIGKNAMANIEAPYICLCVVEKCTN